MSSDRAGGTPLGPGKNNHNIFSSTLGKMTRASVIEGPFCKGWGQKAGIKEIVKFGPLILVDMDGETFL